MSNIDRNHRVASNALWSFLAWIILSVLTAGCAPTTSTILKNPESVQVCLNGECGPATGRFTKDELVGGLLVMLKANENSEVLLCSSDENSRECKTEMIEWFVQGGPIPGHASFREPYLIQVGLDKETSQIKFKMDATVKWIGTPVFCQDAYTELTVTSTDQIVIESNFACTWTLFPHGWNLKFSVGFIDFDKSIIAGNFAVSGGGLLTVGAGSGAFVMRFARKDTLLVHATDNAAKEAMLIPVGQLSPQLLAAPIPLRDEVKETKGGPELAERTLWESVSEENKADGYRHYLSTYPEGRFASTAKANLKAIEQKEAQNKEVALWSKIKDSTDPHDFESYIAQHPKGLFVDLAAVRAQRLRAAANEAAGMDAELALWDQVKGSTDVDEIQVYLKRYPRGQFAGTARNRIKKLTIASKEVHDLEMEMWNKVKDSREIDDFQSFLQAFPNGIFSGIAKSRIENLIRLEAQTEEMVFWNGIKDSSDPKDFEEYLRRYPAGQYAEYARRLSPHLASLKAEREELRLWESIKDSKNPNDFNVYLAQFPEGRFNKVARDRQKAAELAKSMADIDFGQYHALIIGNSDYQYLTDLATAINDAKAVASLLEKAYGFEVTCLTNASRKQIIDALSRCRHTLTQRDNLLIYFAGHGWLDKGAGRGYWLPVDSERDSPANWISTGDISDILKAMAAKHVMVVADSCYSGTLTRSVKLSISSSGYLQRMASKRTRVALSSGGLEPVLDDGGCGHSIFAKAFLDVLERNTGILEGTRLFNEVRRPVILNAPQTPEYADILYAGHEGGDFIFVRK